MKQKIYSISKGCGDDFASFTVGVLVDEIREESKAFTSDAWMKVYRGYKSGELAFEIEANSGLTIIYE